MKIFSLMILLSLVILGLAACGGSTNSNTSNTNVKTNVNGSTINSNQAVVVNSNSNMTNSNANMSNSTSGATTPNAFMPEAAKGGMTEVALGKLATTKAKDAEVKKFAQQMVTDHTKANDELKALAAKKTVTLPTDMGTENETTMNNLSKLSGAEFDKEYVNAMVADHDKAVKLFQMQADSGTDADAKAFAAKTLPTLKMHFTMIKDIQGKMK